MIKISHLILPGKSQNLHFEKKRWVVRFFFRTVYYLRYTGSLASHRQIMFWKKKYKKGGTVLKEFNAFFQKIIVILKEKIGNCFMAVMYVNRLHQCILRHLFINPQKENSQKLPTNTNQVIHILILFSFL